MDSLGEMDSVGEMDVLDENLSLLTLLSICGSNLWPFANFQATEHFFLDIYHQWCQSLKMCVL